MMLSLKALFHGGGAYYWFDERVWRLPLQHYFLFCYVFSCYFICIISAIQGVGERHGASVSHILWSFQAINTDVLYPLDPFSGLAFECSFGYCDVPFKLVMASS